MGNVKLVIKKKKKVTNGLMRCDNDIRASAKILVYLV